MAAKTAKGRARSPETRAKIAAARAGKARDEATKAKIAKSCKGIRKPGVGKGIRKSESHIAALRKQGHRTHQEVKDGIRAGRKIDDLDPPFFGIIGDTYYSDDEIGDF